MGRVMEPAYVIWAFCVVAFVIIGLLFVFRVKFIWFNKPPEPEPEPDNRGCHKVDLPIEVRAGLAVGVLTNDQMATLLRATGNPDDAEAILAEAKQRTYKEGERLTDFELGFIRPEEKGCGSCPDCGSAGFLAGPRGGMAQNFKCGNEECGSRFNDMGPFGIDRISDAQPDALPRTRYERVLEGIDDGN
jgi:hypothetical protein